MNMHNYFHIISLMVLEPDAPVKSFIPKNGDTFRSNPFDLNEDIWTHCGFEWFTLRNRTATDIGNDRWVLTGYHPTTHEAYVAVVAMLESIQ